MIGKTVSHYKILEKLGEGGMGVVYKALDTTLDRDVAIKFLPPQLKSDKDAKKRFVHEAKAASALNHSNIAVIHEIDETPDGQMFIVMAYYDGETLKDRLEHGPLPVDEAVSIVSQIASGLSAAHEKDILHRDIKPANILITERGEAKLADFGLAKLAGQTKLTKTGTTVGTVAYMSPEQASGDEIDARSDVFSLGVVLYELLTGEVPFRGDHEAAVLYGIMHNEPEPLEQYQSDLPEGVQRVIDKAMTKTPDERYSSAADLLADLNKLQEGRQVVALERKTRKNLLTFVLASAAIFLAVFLFVIFKPFKFEVSPDQKAAAAENSLAIMYFDNLVDRDDPQRLGEIVTNLLITDLSESQYMRVVSSQRLYDILKLQRKEGVKVLDKTTATQVATHAGAKWMLLGSILQVEPVFVITSQLVDVGSGSIAASQRIIGVPGETIFTAVDKLAGEAKRDLSLPEEARNEPDTPVADVTTHSIEAYRYYIEGIEKLYKFYFKEAKVSFEKALEHDSTFAMAYLGLANNTVGSREEKRKALEKAVRYSERASKKEQLYIKSASAEFLRDYAEAIKGYETIVEMYPDEKQAHFLLGSLYDSRNREKARANYEKAIEIDPGYKIAYIALEHLYQDLGDFEELIWLVNWYIALAPDEASRYDTRGNLYAHNGKIDKAIESYQEALKRKLDFDLSLENLGHMYLFKREYAKAETYYRKLIVGSDADTRAWGRFCLALIPLYQGKFDMALEVLNRGISADQMEAYEGFWYMWKLARKSRMYAERKDMDRAIAEAEKLLETHQKAYPEDPAAWTFPYAYALARKKDFSLAEQFVGTLKNDIQSTDESRMYWYWLSKGWIELEKGNHDAACTHFEKATVKETWWGLRYPLALAYLKAGRLAKAVDGFEWLLARFSSSRAYNTEWAVEAYYYLGVAYEQSCWVDKAIKQYEEFLDIWKDADPGIEEVEGAKRRLAALKGGRCDEAIAGLLGKIETTPADANLYTKLGRAYQASGQHGEAAAAYKSAAEFGARPKVISAHLLSYLALVQAGNEEEADDYLAELSTNIDKYTWKRQKVFRSIVNLYAGESSEEAILEVAQSDRPKHDRERKTVAYYYLGMGYLLGIGGLEADPVKAAEYFEKCVDTMDAGTLIERDFAEFQLRQLQL